MPKESATSNSKKNAIIAIGSLLGFSATIFGVIAVFFPDKFNLEKKNFAKLSIQVNKSEAVGSLDKFLDLHKGNIVELDVSTCANNENKCPAITTEGNQLSAKYSTDGEYCDGDKNKNGEGITFYFAAPDSKESLWGWEKFEECKDNNQTGVYRISGHFLVPKASGFGQGWTEWLLTPIPDKDIQLKNY
jgi:hypothetical protein